MDLLHLEPAVLLPALLVTLLAVLAARALLGRTSATSSSTSSSAADKKRSVGYGDEAPPSRALAAPAQQVGPTGTSNSSSLTHPGHTNRAEPGRAVSTLQTVHFAAVKSFIFLLNF